MRQVLFPQALRFSSRCSSMLSRISRMVMQQKAKRTGAASERRESTRRKTDQINTTMAQRRSSVCDNIQPFTETMRPC